MSLQMLGIINALIALRARHVQTGLDAMSSTEGRIEFLTDAQFCETFALMSEHEGFVAREDMEFAGAFEMSFPGWVTARFLVWRNRAKSTHLVANVLPKQFLTEFVTCFEGGVTLTSTQNVGAVMVSERPLELFEVFPSKSIEQLWQAHQIAVDGLVKNAGLNPRPETAPIAEAALESARERAAHVKSLWYWKLDCFVRLWMWQTYVNKPVRGLPTRTRRAMRR